jgi:hypothetical protein
MLVQIQSGIMMETFKYPFILKLIYRYGNIPLSILLLFYLVISVSEMNLYWYYVIFVIINLGILILLNRYYFRTYKSFPFTIRINNEKMICSNFFLSKRSVEVYHCNINNIYGGIFDGYRGGPVYMNDSKQNITIGFYQQAGQFHQMFRIILQNINEELYNTLKEKVKTTGGKK